MARFVITTVRNGGRQAPDLVERDFTAERPNVLWVADITYIPTWTGFLYLAVALDAFSRRIVGWAMATTLHAQLVLDALNMALATRRPKDVIHHSDQGSQYTCIEFGKRCREAGARPSMGSVGDAYDNAMAESFLHEVSHVPQFILAIPRAGNHRAGAQVRHDRDMGR